MGYYDKWGPEGKSEGKEGFPGTMLGEFLDQGFGPKLKPLGQGLGSAFSVMGTE